MEGGWELWTGDWAVGEGGRLRLAASGHSGGPVAAKWICRPAALHCNEGVHPLPPPPAHLHCMAHRVLHNTLLPAPL